MVAVAQLVRAPDCGSGGRGFETHQPPLIGIGLILIIFTYSEYGGILYSTKGFSLSASIPLIF